MSLLKGKKGIIFGALDEQSIAWKVALQAKSEGAEFILTNAPVAIRMGNLNELAVKCNAEVIPADATSVEDIRKLIEAAQMKFGKIDFILHSIGMSPNVRKGKEYTNLNYDFFQKTLDISALSLHKILQVCWEKDALSDGASVVALTYIAAQRTFPGYGDMADAKALLESIVRSFGYQYGVRNRVRINTISQSPTITTAGSGVKGFDAFYHYAEKIAPLGNASSADCAKFCVMLFSDYTKMITMQNLYHDGGFSTTGVSQPLMDDLGTNKL